MPMCAYDRELRVETEESHEPSCASEDLREFPHLGLFLLPGGYVDACGTSHQEVELLPITGRVEEFLGSLPGSTTLAGATTGLLTRCVKRIGTIQDVTPSLIGDLLVGDRDYLVLRLREMTFGPRVDALVHCPNLACGKVMDLSFSIEDITIERKPVLRRTFSIDTDLYGIEFRLPTGAFQEQVSAQAVVDFDRLLAGCVTQIGESTDVDATAIRGLSIETRSRIEDAIQRLSPALEIEFEAECPECRRAFLFPVDFTRFFFDQMKTNLRDLELEIHFLAKNYHWAESEILGMPRKKRKRYVSLLRQEMDV